MHYPGSGDFRGRHEASAWQQANRILRVLLCLAGALLLVSLFIPQQKRLTQLRGEVDGLEGQVRDQRMHLGRLTREANLLQTNPTYLETIARDRLLLMKEGETIFRTEPRTGPRAK